VRVDHVGTQPRDGAPNRTELGEAAGRQGKHGRCQPIEGVAGVRTVPSPGEDGVHMAGVLRM
jgi:hypothetical protein